jgi:ribosomal protein S18 acetylase RimI-like enzyme
MENFTIRKATQNDVSFLVETIIEAEKSGTNKLSYSTVFGISEVDTRKYLSDMLFEEIDGCELSISSFILAEKEGQIAGATAAWIEELDGIPSSVLKGNLLNYYLPKEFIDKAVSINPILRDLHIEYMPGTMQLGLVYISKAYRGLNLVSLLIDEHIHRLHEIKPGIKEMFVQVFGNNIPAIKAYEKANFKVVLNKESSNDDIIQYLPSNKKVLMMRVL